MVDILRLLVDFGLFVFIWLVQLVIYPSFLFLEGKKLQRWHSLYMQRLTYVAFPLMVSQLGLVLFQVFQERNGLVMGSLVLVVAVWIITFAYAVPAHRSITKHQNVKESIVQLNRLNWYRTFAWTVCLLLSVLHFWT